MPTGGILSWGSYLPYHRLDRASIRAALGSGGGRGVRTVASYDEDTTSMGVEAARLALRALPADAPTPTAMYFATSAPAYLEKSNAATVHAALGLAATVPAYDFTGAVRSGIGALRAALERSSPTLVVLSDIRGGLPGSSDEASGGDGAVAFVTGADGPQAAHLVQAAGVTKELLDRWRLPDAPAARTWEPRFAERHQIAPAVDALTDALKAADCDLHDLAALGVSGPAARVGRAVLSRLGVDPVSVADDLTGSVGFTGAAHGGLLLAAMLDHASPGDLVATLTVADGADALVLRATHTIATARLGVPLAERVKAGGPPLDYLTYLSWRGHLRKEPPRRPDPTSPLAPAAERVERWKFGFNGSRCQDCGRRHLPPQRVCLECRSVDRMHLERVADDTGTVVTYTVDRLAYSPSPPMVVVAVDFDGGGRFQCELTDADPDSVEIGQRVQMSFRKLHTTDDVHNYFWKAKPIASGGGAR